MEHLVLRLLHVKTMGAVDVFLNVLLEVERYHWLIFYIKSFENKFGVLSSSKQYTPKRP